MKNMKLIAILLTILLFTTFSSYGNKNGIDDPMETAPATKAPVVPTTVPTLTPTSTANPTKIAAPETSFTSEKITVGEGTEWALDGILTMPTNTTGKVPAVVLVHGSGASDMNESSSMHLYTTFKDIAEHLASQGIAVIRYDKRTFTHFAKMVQEFDGSLTMYEETIEDAILATNMLKSDPRIDENKVYILGHSMGGMLAPRIHALGGNFAGLILFAGTPRPLIEVIADQQIMYYTETLEGEALEEFLAEADVELSEQIKAIINMSDDDDEATDAGYGTSLYYYKDNLVNSTENYIKNIAVPFLVMHAGNDLQVFADKDFAIYKELLANRLNVTFQLYEGLNHFFVPSTVTKITELMDEYAIKASVDGQVLQDIVTWIK